MHECVCVCMPESFWCSIHDAKEFGNVKWSAGKVLTAVIHS